MKKLIFALALIALLVPMVAFACNEPANLNLTFMQPCKPAEGTPALAEWRITNPNAFPVPYTVDKYGTGQILSGIAPAGQSFFTTPWGAQTLILKWNGGSKTKAGGNTYNGTDCPVDVPGCTDPNATNYNPDATVDDNTCTYKEKECTSDRYMMATFEKEGQPNCYLISWDGYPAATRSQLCNCGWIADNMSNFSMVEENHCTGKITYDGMDWTQWYRPEMVEPHWGDSPCLAGIGGCG